MIFVNIIVTIAQWIIIDKKCDNVLNVYSPLSLDATETKTSLTERTSTLTKKKQLIIKTGQKHLKTDV